MMNIRQPWICLVACAVLCAASAEGEAPRIVSTDGVTTEMLFALDLGGHVVARDSGSTYPPEAAERPDIGTGHQLNAEAILAFDPTVVVGRERPMSEPGFHLLETAGANVLRLDAEPSVEAAKGNLRLLGEHFGREERAQRVIARLEEDLKQLRAALREEQPEAPKVLVMYLRPNASLLMGADSNAASLVELAGGKLALPQLENYTAVNAEAVAAARPDVILCYEEGLESVGGLEGLLKQPGISLTPAAQQRRIIAMDDLLIGGFGPRTGEAALKLYELLHASGGNVHARASVREHAGSTAAESPAE
jgi:iron complex transport system substrate-binding protein